MSAAATTMDGAAVCKTSKRHFVFKASPRPFWLTGLSLVHNYGSGALLSECVHPGRATKLPMALPMFASSLLD